MALTNHDAPAAPAGEVAPPEDPFIVLHGVPWEQYVAVSEVLGEGHPCLKMVYLEGTLEITVRGPRHEREKTKLARLIEFYVAEKDIFVEGYGEMTRRRKDALRGLEPDECYLFGRELESEDMSIPPDLALEITITSGYIEKLEVYRGLQVPEVWFWKDGRLEVHRLAGTKYVKKKRSGFLPDLDLTALARFAAMPGQTAAIRAFRDWLRGR